MIYKTIDYLAFCFLSDLISHHSASAHYNLALLYLNNNTLYFLASGPLYLLFPLPRTVLLDIHVVCSPTSSARVSPPSERSFLPISFLKYQIVSLSTPLTYSFSLKHTSLLDIILYIVYQFYSQLESKFHAGRKVVCLVHPLSLPPKTIWHILGLKICLLMKCCYGARNSIIRQSFV